MSLNPNTIVYFKNLKWIFVFIFIVETGYSQSIYSVQYESQCDIKVFVVDYESQCDLKVFKVEYESQVKGNEGLWYFVKHKSQSDKKIFFVEYESQSELKIYFANFKSQSGWRNNTKRHLLY